MGNGTVTSKFRLSPLGTLGSGSTAPSIQLNQSNLRNEPKGGPPAKEGQNSENPTESSDGVSHEAPINGVSALINAAESTESSRENRSEIVSNNLLGLKREAESSETYHPSNCNRCYRLKKKCSREYPKCTNCTKSGSDCEYVNRMTKRKRKSPITYTFKESPAHPQNGEVFYMSSGPSAQNQPVHNGLRQVSVSSLLVPEVQAIREVSSTTHVPRKLPPLVPRKDINTVRNSLVASVNHRAILVRSSTNLKEEFITMKAIAHLELPLTFALNYFENFSHKYPFINKREFLDNFTKIQFEKESIVNLDVYLLMSIGCLLYDSKCKTNHYQEYFKEKSIEAVVDVLDLGFNEYDIENMRLLVLLTVYGITSMNGDLCWNLIGMLNRAIVKWDLYNNSDDISKERLVWSIHNLDKELSLLLKKPSQFPNYEYLKCTYPLTKKLYEDENLEFINENIGLGMLETSLTHLRLVSKPADSLTQLSSDFEKWRVNSSKIIHKAYAQSPYLQDYISWINLHYYYLLIELDQVSHSQSFQFTLQFLSSCFTLLISSSDNAPTNPSERKANIKIALSASLFWFNKLFNVIIYNIESLKGILESKNSTATEDTLKLSEFNSNLQLILNLLKYIRGSKQTEGSSTLTYFQKMAKLIDGTVDKLSGLSLHVMKFNNFSSTEDEKQEVLKSIDDILSYLTNSF